LIIREENQAVGDEADADRRQDELDEQAPPDQAADRPERWQRAEDSLLVQL
jgi:hypothetical protein